jgi:hypothetical protein
MTNETNSPMVPPAASPVAASFDRRGLFRIGGITVATAAILAACGDDSGELGRVGVGAPTPTLLDPIVNNSVLLRTSASIEISIVQAYEHILEGGFLKVPSTTYPDLGDETDLVTVFTEHHRKAAETFNGLAEEAGGEPWDCGNPRLDSAYLDVIFTRVEDGAPATDSAPAIPPSDDPTRDYIDLVYTLETLSAASCQALMPQVTESSFRAESMRIGVRSARQSALVSLRINPGVYVSPIDAEAATPGAPVTTTTVAPTTTQNIAAPADTTATGEAPPPETPIPPPVANPTQFGSLTAIQYIGGAGDENGVRLKLNFETPSLNSFTYPFDSCPEG